MFIGNQSGFKAAMLAGVARIPERIERKDSESLPAEVKGMVETLGRTIEEFRAKNDARWAQAEKKAEDAVTVAEVDKLNKAIDDQSTELKKLISDIEAKANRIALGGTESGALEAKAAREFGLLIGQKAYSPENLAEYKADLRHYLATRHEKATTMSVASDPSGGFWVTPDVSGRMVKKMYETTPMRQLANVVQIGSDALEGPIDNEESEARWIGEQAPRTATDTPKVGVWRIPVNELYCYPLVTQKLIEDASIDIEAWIAMKAADKFARKENTGFVTGGGDLMPRGILNYDYVSKADATRGWGSFQYVPTGAAGAFVAPSASVNPADALINLIFELKAGFRQNSNWLMARRTMGSIRKLKDGDGNYLVDVRLRDGALVETILGFKVFEGEDVSAISTNSVSALFGDFNEAYTIVDRLGISVVRDNITTPGFVKYHMRKRTGGGAVNFEAVKGLKFSAS